MVEVMSSDSKRKLRKQFSKFVVRHDCGVGAYARAFRVIRDREWKVFAFGGTPRGVFEYGHRYIPRDLDLVISDEHFPPFEFAFKSHIIRTNRFGGLNIRFGNVLIDAWPLSATWAFREKHISEVSFENLPKTTFLNIDSIAIEIIPTKGCARKIHESGFFSALKSRTLDISMEVNPFPALCAIRNLQMSRRFGLKLSHRLAFYTFEMLSNIPLNDFLKVQISHYKNVVFDANSINQIRKKLENGLASIDGHSVAIFPTRPKQMELGLDWESSIVAKNIVHSDLAINDGVWPSSDINGS